MKETKTWTAEALLELGRSYQPALVFAAAADLELFDAVGTQARTAEELADELQCNLRGLEMLLDALTSLELLRKRRNRYALRSGTAQFLTTDGAHSIAAMPQHQANCARNWAQLAKVIKGGRLAEKSPSV